MQVLYNPFNNLCQYQYGLPGDLVTTPLQSRFSSAFGVTPNKSTCDCPAPSNDDFNHHFGFFSRTENKGLDRQSQGSKPE
jgi:hypothetical protein